MINVKLDKKAKATVSKTANIEGGGAYLCLFLCGKGIYTTTIEQIASVEINDNPCTLEYLKDSSEAFSSETLTGKWYSVKCNADIDLASINRLKIALNKDTIKDHQEITCYCTVPMSTSSGFNIGLNFAGMNFWGEGISEIKTYLPMNLILRGIYNNPK